MKQSKKIRKMLSYNIKTLISFEIIYKILSTVIFLPLFLSMFKLTTKLSGYDYLTFENIISFLSMPITIFFLIILLVFMTFYTIIDISNIIIILDSSYQKKKITLKESILKSLEKSISIFKRKNILLPFFVLFLIPFLNFGISSSFISTIKIPEFIMEYIVKNNFLLGIYIVLIVILAFILCKWLYSFHYFVLENCNFKEARKKSTKLSKGHKIHDVALIVLIQLLTSIIYILFVLLGISIIIWFYKIFEKNIFGSFAMTIIWLFLALSFIIMTALSTPICYATISALYYSHKERSKEAITHIKIENNLVKNKKKQFSKLKYAIIILVIISGTLFTYSIVNNKYNFKIEYVRTIEITAHRGASVYYPENTMAAFVGATNMGTDWIELDVQQTKDKKLIVLHDTNLKRTTGLNKNTWELNYDEIEALDAGSFFSESFKGEKIPLLETVIKYAKENNVKLNIELKPTGHEENFEASVIDLIKKYDFQNSCVVTSQVYDVILNSKKYDKDIKTIYVMSFAYGNILDLEDADGFSIEASSITKPLVTKIHNAGKEIYAWTINSKDSMLNMINLNVDNIITDDISLARDTIYSSKTSNVVQEYINFVNDVLK